MDADETATDPLDSTVPDLSQLPLDGIDDADRRRVLDRVTSHEQVPAAYFQSAL